jgi:hypothetical protein
MNIIGNIAPSSMVVAILLDACVAAHDIFNVSGVDNDLLLFLGKELRSSGLKSI